MRRLGRLRELGRLADQHLLRSATPTVGTGRRIRVVPAGNYLPDVDFSALQGAQLNGAWQFRITDLWQSDNGYLFDWSIQFDSSLVGDCSTIIQ